jgi:alpha-mannosidase
MRDLRPVLGAALVFVLAGSAASSGPVRTLSTAPPPPAKLAFSVKPTLLFVRDGTALKRRIDLEIDNGGEAAAGLLLIRGYARSMTLPLASVPAGRSTASVFVPDAPAAVRVSIELKVGAAAASGATVIEPQRKWTIYLLPHSHTDIGYTDLQSRVAKNHLDYLDSVVEFCKATDAYPDEAKFRWNIEVSWALQSYLRNRPAAKSAALLALLRSGRVELSGLYLQLSDAFGAEELVRAVANPLELSRAHGFPLRAAMNNDVNGFSWGLPQLFVQAGVEYFTTGINETRSRAPLRRPNPFYWKGQDGSAALVWNGEHYLFANYELRLHEDYEKSFPKVTGYLAGLQARGDYPYDLIAFHIGGYVTDNCPPKKELSDRVREWNEKWAYPKLRLATMSEFFTALEKRYAQRIPAYALGWPDYWTDGVGSTAFETGVNRAAHAELGTAETWSALAALADGSFVYPAADLAEGWENTMLYDEHTWGAHNSISEPWSEFARSQWAVKSSFAYTAGEIGRTLSARGLRALAGNIPGTNGPSLAVFNPLSWERSDVVRAALPAAFAGEKKRPFKLVEKGSRAEVSYQIVDGRTLLFQAFAVPALGYSVYEIVPDVAPSLPSPGAEIGENALENRFYRITVDPTSGGLSSVVDKETGEELVDPAAGWTLNQYVYENPIGGRSAVDDMKTRAVFERSSPVAAAATPGLRGPGASSLIIRSKAKPCPSIEQEIVLYDGIKRIDIVDRLMKDEVLDPEALYFAFPFRVRGAQARFELAGATMRPETEQLPRTTRDWHTVQSWVELSGPTGSVVWSPLEAPLVQFGDINTGKWLEKLDLRNAFVFSYAMNNYWMTNFKAGQGGAFTFRYAVTSRSGGSDPLASTRFGWEAQNPLAAVWIPEQGRGGFSASGQSFIELDKPNILVQAVKRPSVGGGITLRLREVAGIETRVRITVPLLRAETVTFESTDIAEGPANIATVVPGSIYTVLKPYGLQTVVVRD